MYLKKLIIFLLILLAIDIVDAALPRETYPLIRDLSPRDIPTMEESLFRCEDNTQIGECNDYGELCSLGANLFDVEDIDKLEGGKEYLFLARTDCFNPIVTLGERRLTTFKIRNRIISQFTSRDEEKNIKIKCKGKEITPNKYLGRIIQTPIMRKDSLYCGEHISKNNCKDGGFCYPYKLGLVYVYNSPETYNPNWKGNIDKILYKTEKGIEKSLFNKVDTSIEILGEVQTNNFCWNPAKIGVEYKTEDTVFKSGNVLLGQIFYSLCPASGFGESGIYFLGKILNIDCPNYKVETEDNGEVTENTISIDCENALTYDNLWKSNKLQLLNNQISLELEIDFNDYDGVFVIFGNLGVPHSTDKKFLDFKCNVLQGYIGGYSNLIMAENMIMEPYDYFVDCRKLNGDFAGSHYMGVGWHILVHEILHRFGAKDVYNTGTTFGIRSYRDGALRIDPRTDESIMGNNHKTCEYEFKNDYFCAKEELEEIYIDKLNQKLIQDRLNYLESISQKKGITPRKIRR
jgi:hypothetical protein